MNPVLLISNEVFQYRVSVYNYLSLKLREEGISFSVVTNKVHLGDSIAPQFDIRIECFGYKRYKKIVEEINPGTVILFLHIRDVFVWPLLFWLKRKGINVIYWGHGINLSTPNNPIKRAIFSVFHRQADAILLYAENEKRYIAARNRDKVFIAHNTLNFSEIPEIPESKEAIRKKYNIVHDYVVLFVGRVTEEKRLGDLLEAANHLNENILVAIVGPGLAKSHEMKIEAAENIRYLGAVYDTTQVNEIFKMADVFSIPGKCGLGINHAMYWGLPVVTEDVRHSPEIAYLRDGENGFIVDRGSPKKLAERISYLLSDPKVLDRFSAAAKKTMQENASIDRMCGAFVEAIQFVTRRKGKVLKS